jgi:hypothetical protein
LTHVLNILFSLLPEGLDTDLAPGPPRGLLLRAAKTCKSAHTGDAEASIAVESEN